MTSAWAHLPNAVHIDRVLESARAHLDHWTESWVMVHGFERGAVCTVEWSKAWSTVQDAGRSAEWWEVRAEVWAVRTEWATAWREAYETLQDALLALIAFDDCGYMLDSDPGELAIIAKFGNTKAVLLLSACKAFHSLKTIA